MLTEILMESLLSMDEDTLDYVLESCTDEEIELISGCIDDKKAMEGALGNLAAGVAIGSLMFFPVGLGICLIAVNIHNAIEKHKNNKIFKNHPGIESAISNCTNEINKAMRRCVKSRLESSAYFNSPEYKKYVTNRKLTYNDDVFDTRLDISEDSDSVVIKYDNYISAPDITVKYISSDDEMIESMHYNKIANPVFDKVEKEFNKVIQSAAKDLLSDISKIESKYNCAIKFQPSNAWLNIDGYMDDGYTYNTARADSKFTYRITMNTN